MNWRTSCSSHIIFILAPNVFLCSHKLGNVHETHIWKCHSKEFQTSQLFRSPTVIVRTYRLVYPTSTVLIFWTSLIYKSSTIGVVKNYIKLFLQIFIFINFCLVGIVQVQDPDLYLKKLIKLKFRKWQNLYICSHM